MIAAENRVIPRRPIGPTWESPSSFRSPKGIATPVCGLARNDIGDRDQSSSSFRTAMKASLGTDTVPKVRIRFLPSFCFSSSFFFLVMSPP